MRAANRVIRVVVAFVVLGLSVSWLLRRRRSAEAGPPARLRVVPPPSPPTHPEPPDEPRAPERTLAAGRPGHDAGDTLLEAPPVPPAAPPAPTQADNLRQVRGIGPATEAALHGIGIHTFRQLATLNPAGIEQVKGTLRDFRQRVEREDWTGQARELHRAKYGEEPTAGS